MKRSLRFLIPIASLFVIVTAAYAGGWAIVTLNHLPDYAVAEKALPLTFSVRQHGMTLLSGLKPTVRATSATGLKASAAVRPTANKGEYTASLIMPEAGEWTITIVNGFDSTPIVLPLLKVIAPDSPAPHAFAEGTRGGRLFVAKGCIGCHRHVEINPARQSSPALDLTGKRFPHDEFTRFLADPGIKQAEMPNLNLKQDEIAALAAFINKTSAKLKQVR
jgi:mono/diheme cytochrome c family protein